MGKFIYFTIDELCNSEKTKKYNIKNKPNGIQKRNLSDLIINILDPACAILDSPIIISLGFCNEKLRNEIDSSLSIDYSEGYAVKCTCLNPTYLYNIIKELNDFDELFIESENGIEYVYVSFKKGDNRKHLGHIKDNTFTWKNF